MSVDTAV